LGRDGAADALTSSALRNPFDGSARRRNHIALGLTCDQFLLESKIQGEQKRNMGRAKFPSHFHALSSIRMQTLRKENNR